MPCIHGPGFVMTVGGPTLKIRIGGKPWLFEDHEYLGPMPVRANGNERKATMAFWNAMTRWYQSGKKIGKDGWCVWDETSAEPPRR